MTLELTRDELTQVELALIARAEKGYEMLATLAGNPPGDSAGVSAALEIVKQALHKVQEAKRLARRGA